MRAPVVSVRPETTPQDPAEPSRPKRGGARASSQRSCIKASVTTRSAPGGTTTTTPEMRERQQQTHEPSLRPPWPRPDFEVQSIATPLARAPQRYAETVMRPSTRESCRQGRLPSERVHPGSAGRGTPPRGRGRPAPTAQGCRSRRSRTGSGAQRQRSSATSTTPPVRKRERSRRATRAPAGNATRRPSHARERGDAYAYCKTRHPGAIQPRWTRELVLDAMRAWQERYGRPPSSYDWSPTHARRR